MRRKQVVRVTAAGLVCALLGLSTGLAGADQLNGDDLVSGGDTTRLPGGSGSAAFFLQPTGPEGCNASSASPVTVTVTSDKGWLSIAAPGRVSLTACRSGPNPNAQAIGYSVSSTAPAGEVATISGSATGGRTGNDGFNLNNAAFTVTVAAAPDATPPAISYALTPAAPTGANGWYTGDVSLAWTVSEPQSPASLTKTGCVDQNLIADQAVATYRCSATSTGGSAGPVEVSIKRDATAPVVTLAGGPADGATYYENYDVPAAPTCGATDATSGVNGSCSVNGYSAVPGVHTVSASALDVAGNTGTSASRTYTVVRDTTPPDIQGTLEPGTADGSNGWYRSNVRLSWQVAEPETGGSVAIATGTCQDQNVTADQAETTYTCAASSLGGSAGPASVSIKRDAIAPAVTMNGGPADGAVYYEDYDVPDAPTCGATDATSGVNGSCSVSGYGSPAGTYTVSASATDFAGNTGTSDAVTYTVVEDTTPPVITATVDPAAADGDDGWYRTNVSVSWSVSEPETPLSVVIDDGCADQAVTADQVATTYSCSAHSVGGSAGPVDVVIKRDAAAPTVTLDGGPADGATYYESYNVPSAPTCEAADVTSGVDGVCSISGYGATAGTYTVSASAVDRAGNAGTSPSVTYTVVKDVTAPVIGQSVDPASPDGDNGWYRSDVSLEWTVTEAQTPLSLAVTPGTCEDQDVTADQAATTYTCSASSVGGSAGPVAVTIKRDATPPTVTCPASPQFVLNSAGNVVTASVSDATSGPASATVSAAADTSSVGSKAVTLTGYDNAGNSAQRTCSYTVGYTFVGYSSPVDNPGWVNKLKAGQAIPLKWRLLDANGHAVTNLPTATLTVQGRECTSLGTSTDLLEETAAGGSPLQNLGNGYYQLNWKSPSSYANSCKALTLDIGEGTGRTHDAYFMFTR